MKKVLALVLALCMTASVAACGSSKTESAAPAEKTEEKTEAEAPAEEKEEAGETYKAALLLNGNLGDKSFYDSANEGLSRLRDDLGKDVFDFKVEEMGATAQDESKWGPTLMDYCATGEYDVIIMGTWQMADLLAEAADEYPDQKFMFFDEQFDFEGNGNPENIYNILFKQNEVSYLVGACAAMMTTDTSIAGINADKKIAFLGGMDNAVISDFYAGYEQGAKDVDPEIEIIKNYVGNFYDSANGKELSLAMYNDGADMGFNVAGNAGLGLIEAATEKGLYAFGVDSDQAALLPENAANIPTSALKNVGNALYRSITMDMEGSLAYGTTEALGFAEGGVELVKDAHYEEMVPEAIRTAVDELEAKITDGEIVVNTAIDR